MKDFKLKLVLTILTGIVFSFFFIILAFVLPTQEKKITLEKKPDNLLEEVSKSIKSR